MAKSKSVAKSSNKKSIAIKVFDIIFIILALVGVVGALMLFTPIQNMVSSNSHAGRWDHLYNWVYYHILKPFKRNIRPNLSGNPSKPFTAAFFLWLLYLSVAVFFYLLYQPFAVRTRNKAKEKTQVYRKVLCWITFAFVLVSGLFLFSLLYRVRLEKRFGAAYSWYNNLVDRFANSFRYGKLSVRNLKLISVNGYFNFFAYATFGVIFVELVLLLVAGLGKAKKPVEVKKEEPTPVPTEEKQPEVEDEEEAHESVPYIAPKVATVQAEEKAKPEKVEPTFHDINLLNKLECIHAEPIKDLPGLSEKDLASIRSKLVPDGTFPVEDVTGKQLLEKLDTVSIEIKVLPAIDEWNADPWKAEVIPQPEAEAKEVDISMFETVKPVTEPIEEPKEEPKPVEEPTPVIEEIKPVEEPEPVKEPEPIIEEKAEEEKKEELTDLTASAAPAERKEVNLTEVTKPAEKPAPAVEEVKEAVEEKEEEEGPIILAINDNLSDGKRPQEENHDKEESLEHSDRTSWKKSCLNNQHKEVVTEDFAGNSEWILPKYVAPKVTGPVTICINQIVKDGKRPQEEVHVRGKAESFTDRSERKQTTKDTSHRPITTQTAEVDNTWILPEYVAPKVTSNVKKIDLAPISKPNGRPKPSGVKPITPIKPVAPVKEEKTVEEKKEEPKPIITPIAGPLHSTAKSKHEKIEAVKARRVPFTLQNYQLKTYKGNLTAEQAFSRGVTKVQPTARPIFANQGNESSWKQKRREEEIRKNGYSDVTKVDKLNGKVEQSSQALAPSGSSIRELRNSIKAEKAKQEEAPKREEKPTAVKPITPIKPITPVKPVEGKTEEPKKEEAAHPTTASFFHPIAPLAKKPGKRPEIKPVDPFSKKK